jgi:hypothetical protein
MTVRQLVDPNLANRDASQPPSVGAPALENQRQERNRSPLAVCYFQGFDLTFDLLGPPPREWLSIPDQIRGTDSKSIASLVEWFGSLLGPDMEQPKILIMVGPKRSGRVRSRGC